MWFNFGRFRVSTFGGTDISSTKFLEESHLIMILFVRGGAKFAQQSTAGSSKASGCGMRRSSALQPAISSVDNEDITLVKLKQQMARKIKLAGRQ
jgi:hypothetical protein